MDLGNTVIVLTIALLFGIYYETKIVKFLIPYWVLILGLCLEFYFHVDVPVINTTAIGLWDGYIFFLMMIAGIILGIYGTKVVVGGQNSG